MATNVKAKKKKGTYDNPKLFMIVTISLAIVIALITVISIIVYTSSNYIGKVNGKKIYDYEYEYYLYLELSKMQSEIDVTGLSEDKKEEKYKEFWTKPDENGVYPDEKAKQNALEEARKFKASYLLAVKEGYKLSKQKRTNVKSNIDATLSTWMSYYAQMGLSITREDMIRELCATMTLNEYKEYMIQYSAIAEYKESLKKTYNISDEEVKSIYEKDIDKYRFVDVRVLFMKAINEKKEEMSEEEYKKLLEEANKIAKSFNETGKYEDKDFVEYIKENSDEDLSNNGLYTINKDQNEHSSKKVNEFAYGLKQSDFKENGFTEYKVIEDKDTKGIYVVRGEYIVDLDTPVPEEKEEGTEKSTTEVPKKTGQDIKDRIIAERKEEMGKEEIEKAVSGPQYAVTNLNNKKIQEYIDEYDLKNP